MKIDVLTLFPEMFSGVFNDSILKRAQERGAVELIQLISVISQRISIKRLMIIRMVGERECY